MNLLHPVIAVAAAAVAVAGVAGCGSDTGQGAAPSTVTVTAQQTSTPAKTPSPVDTSKPPTSGAGDSTAADKLNEENLIRERLYHDVTGHSFMGNKPGKGETLSACTGDKSFADSVPRGATILSYKMVGEEDGLQVLDQVAQVGSADKARTAANRIVKLVHQCAGISGGDFGYGNPITVESNAKRKVVYLLAYDSDRAAGGYIVIQAGNRVAVVDVIDDIPARKVAKLAKEAAAITAD